MACGCSEACNCFLDSSDTVAVSGSGTVGDPFIPVVVADPDGGLVAGVVGVALVIDPASTAPVSVSAAGLLVDCCGVAVMDSPTIDFDIALGAVTGDVIPDPDGGLENTAAGVAIEVDPASTADVSISAAGLRVDINDAAVVAAARLTGEIVDYAGPVAPAGWLLADGALVATATYPDLFGVIGYTYGGAGANFNLPDYRGRTGYGVGAHADVNALADNDGLADAARTPVHTHTGPSHTHTATAVGTNAANTSGNANDDGEAVSHHTGYILRESGRTQLIAGAAALVSVDMAPTGAGSADSFTKLLHNHPVPAQVFTGTAALTTAAGTGATGATPVPFVVVNKIIKT